MSVGERASIIKNSHSLLERLGRNAPLPCFAAGSGMEKVCFERKYFLPHTLSHTISHTLSHTLSLILVHQIQKA